MKKQIPPPAYWQDFEELCHKLWREIWGDINTQKNGRQGQKQNGVDIYGIPRYKGEYYGVQCKGKDINYKSQLTIEEIEEESKKAENFTPNISDFTIATTSPRDAYLQEKVRDMNSKNERLFPINIWSWDDISDEIQFRPELYKKLYNEELNTDKVQKIILCSFEKSDKLFAFLSRPYIRDNFSEGSFICIGNVLSELMDNSFRHGKASKFSVELKDENTIIIIDNGIQFNFIDQLSPNGNGGHLTIKHLLDYFKEDLNYEYKYLESENILTLMFNENSLKKENIIVEKEFPGNKANAFITKDEAINYAKKNIIEIKETNNNAKLLIKDYGCYSSCIAYLETICKEVPERIISVSLPHEKSDAYEHILNSYGVKYNKR